MVVTAPNHSTVLPPSLKPILMVVVEDLYLFSRYHVVLGRVKRNATSKFRVLVRREGYPCLRWPHCPNPLRPGSSVSSNPRDSRSRTLGTSSVRSTPSRPGTSRRIASLIICLQEMLRNT